MVRTAFSLVIVVVCAFFLARSAHAQEISPRSYLFVEVADATGQTLDQASVRVSGPDGKELANLTTSRNGIAETTFNHSRRDHYDLHVSKTGYLPYETVLFPDGVYHRPLVGLTEELPNTPVPSSVSRLKIILRKSTPAEPAPTERDAKKRQLLFAVKRGDAAGVRNLLQQGVSPDTADAKGVPAVAWATFAGDP